jgi:hypothetical protein
MGLASCSSSSWLRCYLSLPRRSQCTALGSAPKLSMMKQHYAEWTNLSGRVGRGLTNGSVISGIETVARWRVFLWSVTAVGIVLRVTRYLADRSLWGDEGALALNLIQKPAADLVEPLDYLQGAPTGFLLAEKAIMEVLGADELALRLFPLACGILSLFLFAAVARRILEPVGAAFALVLFATAEPLVYYSSEVKQYSVDVAATLVLFYGALAIEWRKARAWQVGLAGMAAGLIVWFSHAALIVLPALALALLVTYGLSRHTRAFKAVLAASAVGGIGAAGAYLVNHDNARRVASAAVSSEAGSTIGFAQYADPVRDLWNAFADPVGLARTTTGVGLIACVLGGIALMRLNRQQALMILTPIAATLAASTLDLYPFGDRFILFLVPFFLLLVGAGLDVLLRAPSRAAPFGALAVLLILSYPIARATSNLVNPPEHEELKTVLGEVQARWEPGDALYVWYQSQYPFRYYAECSDCDVLEERGPAEVVARRGDLVDDYALASDPPRLFVGGRDYALQDYANDLARLQGAGRTWLLFSSTWNDDFVRYTLDCVGMRLEEFRAFRAVAYLYDFTIARSASPGCIPEAAAPTTPDG